MTIIMYINYSSSRLKSLMTTRTGTGVTALVALMIGHYPYTGT